MLLSEPDRATSQRSPALCALPSALSTELPEERFPTGSVAGVEVPDAIGIPARFRRQMDRDRVSLVDASELERELDRVAARHDQRHAGGGTCHLLQSPLPPLRTEHAEVCDGVARLRGCEVAR